MAFIWIGNAYKSPANFGQLMNSSAALKPSLNIAAQILYANVSSEAR